MIASLDNIPNELQTKNPLETVKVENFEGIGDLTIGVGGNWNIIVTALCLLNDPQINKFMLAQKLNLFDRITKTKIFPRNGMALPTGKVYQDVITEDKKEE